MQLNKQDAGAVNINSVLSIDNIPVNYVSWHYYIIYKEITILYILFDLIQHEPIWSRNLR